MTVAGEADVPSPCVDVCELDADGLCMGCFRNGDEITAWPMLGNEGKRHVLAVIDERRRLSEESAGD